MSDLEVRVAGSDAEITAAGALTAEAYHADRLIDDGTQQPYFAGNVEIDEQALPDAVKHRLLAGLPAEVVVSAGERTALEYLFAPFFDAMGRAFHER